MMNTAHIWKNVLGASLFSVATAGCVCGTPPNANRVVAPIAEDDPKQQVSLDKALLAKTWAAGLTSKESLEVIKTPGWMALVKKRNIKDAVQKLGEQGGLPAARAHLDAAALFRMGALSHAFSLIEVYGETPESTDPHEVHHLLTVSYTLLNKRGQARTQAAKLGGKLGKSAPWHLVWTDWLAGENSEWPPAFQLLPQKLPPVKVGAWPTLPEEPSYGLKERDGSTAVLPMTDPALLVMLAQWHQSAAEMAAGKDAGLRKGYRAGYSLPIIPQESAPKELPFELLYGSDLLMPADGAFMADLHGKLGKDAVAAHAKTSLLASMAQAARIEGALDAEKAMDLAHELRIQLETEGAKAQDKTEPPAHTKMFAKISEVGALRSLALVAEVEGDRETSGRLRITAWEKGTKSGASPVGILALAAWDASNRNPVRALDILHNLTKRYPSLEVARYGLNVLGLRRGGEISGETPGM